MTTPAASPSPARFPYPEFPQGWFAVAWADEAAPGQAVPIRAFGQDLVLFRAETGALGMLDAHCPHLGAHLGHGGTVVNGQVVCPFHGWSFTNHGRCTHAPGARKLPAERIARSWTVVELHNRIWAWHAVTDEMPTWSLPNTLLPPGKRWSNGGRVDRTFPSHPQDIVENAVDPLHFRFIHGMSELLDSQTEYADQSLTTILQVRSKSDRFGIKGYTLSGEITVRVYGLGLQTVQTCFTVDKLGLVIDTIVVEGISPRGDGQASLLIDVHMARIGLPRLDRIPMPGVTRIARAPFVKAVADDVDGDIAVWANRRHLDRPRLTAADSEIGRYRQWTRRFYPHMATAV